MSTGSGRRSALSVGRFVANGDRLEQIVTRTRDAVCNSLFLVYHFHWLDLEALAAVRTTAAWSMDVFCCFTLPKGGCSLRIKGIQDEAQRIPARRACKHTYPHAESSPCPLLGHASVPQCLVPSSPHSARTRLFEGYSVRSKRFARDGKSSHVSMP